MATDTGFKVEDYPPPAYNKDDPLVEQAGENSGSNDQRLRDELIQLSQLPPESSQSEHEPNLQTAPYSQTPSPDLSRRTFLHLLSPSTTSSDFSSTIGPRRSWASLNRDLLIILTLNVPFLAMFIMDITGTFILPTSAFYRTVIHRAIFDVFFVIVSTTTAAVNILWFFSPIFGGRARHEATRVRIESQSGWRRRWSILVRVVKMLVFVIGLPAWVWISMSIHRRLDPMYPSCGERGYGSSVLVSVVSGKEVRFGVDKRVNNVTIESGEDVLGFKMAPGIPRLTEDGVVSLVLDEGKTSTGLLQRVQGVDVKIDLGEKTYGFSRGDNVTSNGTFVDNRNYYLSFPKLGIHSTDQKNWTYVDYRPDTRLVDESRVVLVSVEEHPKDSKDKMFRMCAAWSVEEMVGREKMEEVLVPLGRVGIEMAIWGRGH